jgi:uncharacterized protein (DUF58 family)
MNGVKLGLLLLALLIAATIADWDGVAWLFYSGLALLAIAFIWARGSLIGIGLSRTLDADRVFAGDEIRERFRIRNRSLIPKTWVAVHDRSTLPGHTADRAVSIGSRKEGGWVTRTRAERRGRYRLGPIELRSGDPFGLFTEHRKLDLTHELLVYPALVPLPPRSRAGGDLSGASRIAPGRTAGSPVIRSLRQYAVGDPMNQIAWRASARHGSLLVKELEPDPVSDEWILLDLAPVDGTGRRKVIEYAVSLAASYAMEWLGAGRDVGLLVNRAIPAIVSADAGDRQRLRILETLAIVEPYGQADPGELIARFAGRFSRTTGLLVVSTGSGDNLVTPLRHLAQRGVPLMVVAVAATGDGHGASWSDVEGAGVPVTRVTPDGERQDAPAVAGRPSLRSVS